MNLYTRVHRWNYRPAILAITTILTIIYLSSSFRNDTTITRSAETSLDSPLTSAFHTNTEPTGGILSYKIQSRILNDQSLIQAKTKGGNVESPKYEETYNYVVTLMQDDEKFVNYAKNYITPPSIEPYNFWDASVVDPGFRVGQGLYARHLLHNMTDGFYIECGANDGERFSNSLYFERFLNWNGLLVEANPNVVPLLKAKNRKAWIAEVCLSTVKHFQLSTFTHDSLNIYASRLGKLQEDRSPVTFQVPCLPLYTILRAIGITTVDYFSLDIEGAELGVLKTIPFDKILFKVLSIEINLIPVKELHAFMVEKGFKKLKRMFNDYIYIHKSVDYNKAPFKYESICC